ncbi:C4-type zinc ribbon domain-containing protein [Streptomyces sodiiphilus]|uniref:C4-type zinc ribbon domain-containing protein n=1 Tax=Streptomyces sodiiphilus TaxID=226217 RepID=A0ABN2NX39_9ACTN
MTQQRDLLVAARTEAGDTGREQTKAEQDVEQVRSRAERDRRRLESGMVTSPKDLESLQSEIASLAKRQDDLETVVLEIMERHEAAQARAEELDASVQEIGARVEETAARRDAATREIDAEADRVRKEREVIAGSVPEALLKLYDKLCAQHGGVGAARLYQKSCEGCRLELNVTELGEVRAAPPNEVLRCENCRRILVRTPESGL